MSQSFLPPTSRNGNPSEDTTPSLEIYEKSPHSKETSSQIELLKALLIQSTSNDSKFEFIWNAVLQSIGILFAVVFGTFSVLAYLVGQSANRQSMDANKLSLLSLCLSNSDPNAKSVCAGLYQQPSEPIASLARAVFGTELPSATSTPSSTSTQALNPTATSAGPISTVTTTALPTAAKGSSGPSLSGAAIAGLAIGSVLLIASIVSSIVAFRQKYYKVRLDLSRV